MKSFRDIKFVCVLRSGGDFDEEYVRVLASHVSRKTFRNHEFICLSDTVKRIVKKDGITWLPLVTDFPGRWSKIELFRPDLKSLLPWVFLDLDTAIVGKIDSILRTLFDCRGFAMLHDFYKPDRPASGIMYMPEGMDTSNIWNTFNNNPKAIMAETGKWQDDGKFIYECHYPELIFQTAFPEQILTYKPMRQPGRPERLKEVPPTAKIVCFHGNPRPKQAVKEMAWVADYWEQGAYPEFPSDYRPRHKGTLLVVGSGPTWKADYQKAVKLRPDHKVMVLGHAAGFVKADFVVSDHYEIHKKLTELQCQFHNDFTNHCSYSYSATRESKWIDHFWKWDRAKATSMETAVRIGLTVGFEEIILCGCPLEAGKIQHPDQVKKDGSSWPPPNKIKGKTGEEELNGFRREFCKLVPGWKDKVFSMSGFTGRILGAPSR